MAKNRKTAGHRGGNGSKKGRGRWFYAALAVVAIGGVAALLLAGRKSDSAGGSAPLSLAESEVPADPNAGETLGPADAPVTLIEFGDYQCPHCAEFESIAGHFIKENYARPGKIRFVFYDFPLGFPNSMTGAMAARCAGAQGKYWTMQDVLYGRQLKWSRDKSPKDKFVDYAKELGLDPKKFARCYDSRSFTRQIVASKKYGVKVGVQGTPTLFLDGKQIQGIPNYKQLASMLDSALASAKSAGGQKAGAPDAPKGTAAGR